MRTKIFFIYILLSLIPATVHSQSKAAEDTLKTDAAILQLKRKYTEARPLVYEDVWDLDPYSFVNDKGEPAGFNVDLMKLILDRLEIPYVIKLKHTPENFEDVRTGKADLTIGMRAHYHDKYGKYGNSVLALFTHSVAVPKTMNANIKNFSDLEDYDFIVHKGSFSHHTMMSSELAGNVIPMEDMKATLMQVNATDSGIVLWNTLTLKALIKKYDLHNLKTYPVNMKYGEYRFISNDTVLLHKLDSVYNELLTNEELLPIRRKWYYPNTPEEVASYDYVWYAAILAVIILLLFLFYRIYYRIEEKRVRILSKQQSKRLALLLKTRNVKLWTFNVNKRTFTIIDPTSERNEEYNAKSFAVFFDSEGIKLIMDSMKKLGREENKSKTLNIKSRYNTDDGGLHTFELNISVLRMENGTPSIILGVQRDMTSEKRKLIETNDFLLKYKTVFNTAMADLAYYDKDGYLIDINEKACETYQISDRQAFIKQKSHISDIPMFKSLNGKIEHQIWTSTIINLDKLEEEEFPKYWGRKGMVYYEFVIIPIYDENGALTCYVAAGQDMTVEAEQENRERQRMNRIKNATEEIKNYTENINYALDVSNGRLANYYPSTSSMVVTHDMHKPKMRLSQLNCMRILAPHYRDRAANMLMGMDKGRVGLFNVRMKTRFKEPGHEFTYYDINGLPMRDSEGNVTHYFCLCRNVTDLIETERQLEAETKKAQEAEVLKSSFLTNMSYQIRTPLNAVVGFAELFGMPHDKEDETIFREEIKKNSDIMLELVNSILLLSRLDARMVEITKTPTEIVSMITTYSMIGWGQGLREGVNTFIDTPYDRIVLDVDNKNLGLVIQMLVELAVLHTEEGFIRTRFTYRGGILTIMVEDTGPGMASNIPADLSKRIFPEDGNDKYIICLKLQICAAFMQIMGGNMEIESQLGKGTTIWLTLPCEMEDEANNNLNNETNEG